MEGELTRVRAELEAKSKEMAALKAAVNKQITEANKKLEESSAKRAVSR